MLLNEYIAEILNEVSELPSSYFSSIDSAILGSTFWTYPNDEEDDPDADGPGKTPAASALESALSKVFDDLGLDIDVMVGSYFTADPDYTLHPQHPAYPNRWLIDANWYVSKDRPGRNTIDLWLMLSDEDNGFDVADINPNALMRHIAQTVRHELVHYTQMKKQAANKGLSDLDTFDEMLNDPSQIPQGDSSDPEWQKKYLSSHIEIDAHAHDAAEELLAVFDDTQIRDILRGKGDMSDSKMPNAIQHYFEVLGPSDPATRKFLGKTYAQVEKMKKYNQKNESCYR